MSSLNGIMSNAASGVMAAQTQLNTISNNIANINTTGYVREVANQQSMVAGGAGDGVTITSIQNAANQYLQTASLSASSSSGQQNIVSTTIDQAQALFGDPSSTTSYFSTLDNVFTAFSTLAATPSTAGQSQALANVQTFLSQSSDLSTSLGQLSSQSDTQIASDVTQVNQLLTQIDGLNADISRATATGSDATGSQNQQAQLINTLSTLMNVNVSSLPSGGSVVRAADGTALAGDGSGPATLSYSASGPSGQLSITNGTGVTQPVGAKLSSGELQGLLQLRNVDLPQMQSQLSELTSGVASQLNTISNSYSSVPPPTTMTGQNTGLDIASAISGFTGKTTIAEVNTTTSAVDHQISIDFGAGTISVDGGAATSFTPATFLTKLNTAMGAGGSATFTNGALTLNAPNGDGIAIQDNPTTPSSNGGQGFSAYFGLNNLVTSSTFTNYNTGLTSTSASGFPAGQTLQLQLSGSSGALIQDVTVTTPAGTTMASMLGALNASPGGVGAYGAFSLNSKGQLSFAANNNSGVTVAVVADNTANTATGASISQLFGIGAAARNNRTGSYSVNSAVLANPSTLPMATLNLSAAAGTAALAAGDTSGADALGQAGGSTYSFNAAGGLPAATISLSDYAANISASVALKASNAAANKTQAQAVATEATSRLGTAEGVNLDTELVNLTTYQQSYNASARMIQAAENIYTTLLGLVN
jgi:flagellar hook-associated protein 1 FlgK